METKYMKTPILTEIPALGENLPLNEGVQKNFIALENSHQFALRVSLATEEGLYPIIRAGDIIICDTKAKPEDRDIVAARWHKNEVIRLLSIIPNNPDKYLLLSYNNTEPPRLVSREETAIYKVVLIKKFS